MSKKKNKNNKKTAKKDNNLLRFFILAIILAIIFGSISSYLTKGRSDEKFVPRHLRPRPVVDIRKERIKNKPEGYKLSY